MKWFQRLAIIASALIVGILAASHVTASPAPPPEARASPPQTLCAADSDCDEETACQPVRCRGGLCTVIRLLDHNEPCENGGHCSAGSCSKK